MKPLGISAAMKVLHPSRAEDAIWTAVREAIASGMSPQQFRGEAADAWEHELHEQAKTAVNTLLGKGAP